jgi:hypothetical protein
MKPYPLCMILLFVSGMVVGQSQPESTGIYLTIKCSRKIPRQPVVLTGRPVCLAPNPLISAADFESIGEVVGNDVTVYFEVTFRPKARERLAMLTANLPTANLALVVDKEAFCVFKAEELKVLRTFRFQGYAKDTEAFHRIYAKLRAEIVAN